MSSFKLLSYRSGLVTHSTTSFRTGKRFGLMFRSPRVSWPAWVSTSAMDVSPKTGTLPALTQTFKHKYTASLSYPVSCHECAS